MKQLPPRETGAWQLVAERLAGQRRLGLLQRRRRSLCETARVYAAVSAPLPARGHAGAWNLLRPNVVNVLFPPAVSGRRCVRPDQSSATVRCHYLTDGTVNFAFTMRRAEYFIPAGVLLKCFLEVGKGPRAGRRGEGRRDIEDGSQQMLVTPGCTRASTSGGVEVAKPTK